MFSSVEDNRLFLRKSGSGAFVELLLYDGIDYGHCGDVYNVANRTLEVGKVNRFLKTHLDRPYRFGIAHFAEQFVG